MNALETAKTEVEQAVAAVQALAEKTRDAEHQSAEQIKKLFGERRGDVREQLDTIREVILNLAGRVAALEAGQAAKPTEEPS